MPLSSRAQARQSLDVRLPREWLDIALLLAALGMDSTARSQVQPLDHWLEHLAIATPGRHAAAAGAYATAQLLLITLHCAKTRGIHDTRGLRRLPHEVMTKLANSTIGSTGA